MKTNIISAFPACGKTYCYKNLQKDFDGIIDSDSSQFSWVVKNGEKQRNPDFPQNYIKHIKENIGKVEIIFISSHDVVRQALKDNNIEYTLIYPAINQKEEWIKRFKDRGDDDKFINFISNNWSNFIIDMEKEKYPVKIKLPHQGENFITKDLLLNISK